MDSLAWAKQAVAPLPPPAGQPGTCAFKEGDAWGSSCPARQDPAPRKVPAEGLMLPLT